MSSQILYWLPLRPCCDSHSDQRSVSPSYFAPTAFTMQLPGPPLRLSRLLCTSLCPLPTLCSVSHAWFSLVTDLPSLPVMCELSPSSELCLGYSFCLKLSFTRFSFFYSLFTVQPKCNHAESFSQIPHTCFLKFLLWLIKLCSTSYFIMWSYR